jgi:hypothetical protein
MFLRFPEIFDLVLVTIVIVVVIVAAAWVVRLVRSYRGSNMSRPKNDNKNF